MNTASPFSNNSTKIQQPTRNNPPSNANFQLVLQNLETTSRRLKLSEEKQTLLSRKFELLEQNLVNFERSANQKISKLSEQLQTITKEVNEIKETIDNILQTLKNVANKNSVKEIKKYLELWNPVKFATIDDVKRILQEEIYVSREKNTKIKKDLNKLFFK